MYTVLAQMLADLLLRSSLISLMDDSSHAAQVAALSHPFAP
ncbi:MAG TPA: hypothetical protein VGE16_14585 [Albitalea sp.]